MYFDSTGCATALLSNSLNTILLILTLSRFGQVCRLNIVQVRHVTSDDDVTDSHQRRTRRQWRPVVWSWRVDRKSRHQVNNRQYLTDVKSLNTHTHTHTQLSICCFRFLALHMLPYWCNIYVCVTAGVQQRSQLPVSLPDTLMAYIIVIRHSKSNFKEIIVTSKIQGDLIVHGSDLRDLVSGP